MTMHVFNGVADLLEEIWFAIMNLIEGCVAVISFLPTLVENVLLSLELFILGMYSCINFIFTIAGYILIFLMDLPSNVGRVIHVAANGVEVLISWIVLLLEFILTWLSTGLKSVGTLFENGIFYMTELTSTSVNMIPNTNVIIDVLSHADKTIKSLAVSVLNGFNNFVSLPSRMVQNLLHLSKELLNVPFVVVKGMLNFFSKVVSTLLSFTFGTFNHLWRGLTGCFGNIWTALWPFSPDSVYLNGQQDVENEGAAAGDVDVRNEGAAAGDVLYTGNTGWLARFSQLMLSFAVIILIAVLLTFLYHLRHKIHATLMSVATVAINTVQGMSVMEHRAVNVNGNRGDRQLLDAQNNDEDEDAGGDGVNIVNRDNEVHNKPVVRNRRMPHDGGESSRRVAERGASPAPPPPNYEKLLQQEKDKQLCVVCQDKEKDTLLLPCKHLCVCNSCVDHITNAADLDRRRCPLCRKKITAYVDVFT